MDRKKFSDFVLDKEIAILAENVNALDDDGKLLLVDYWRTLYEDKYPVAQKPDLKFLMGNVHQSLVDLIQWITNGKDIKSSYAHHPSTQQALRDLVAGWNKFNDWYKSLKATRANLLATGGQQAQNDRLAVQRAKSHGYKNWPHAQLSSSDSGPLRK